MCIAYLDVWTEHDLLQAIKLIELKRMRQPIPLTDPPLFESPPVDGRPVPMTPVYRAVMFRDGGSCILCGSTEALQFDHIIPRDKGGADSYGNLRVLCRKCNIRKSNRS